jgi:hypothetical protein
MTRESSPAFGGIDSRFRPFYETIKVKLSNSPKADEPMKS